MQERLLVARHLVDGDVHPGGGDLATTHMPVLAKYCTTSKWAMHAVVGPEGLFHDVVLSKPRLDRFMETGTGSVSTAQLLYWHSRLVLAHSSPAVAFISTISTAGFAPERGLVCAGDDTGMDVTAIAEQDDCLSGLYRMAVQ